MAMGMSKKKRNIILAIVAIILVIVLVVGIILGVYFTRSDAELYLRARQILAMNFQPLELGKKEKIDNVVDEQNPWNLIEYNGVNSVQELWKNIPDNLKSSTALVIATDNILLSGGSERLDFLESTIEECNNLDIPFLIQAVNGRTHMEARLPIAYLERFASNENYRGLTATNLFEGESLRGAAESDQTEYMVDAIKLCAKYGKYFVWKDENTGYKHGTMAQYVEKSENLYSAMQEYSDYVLVIANGNARNTTSIAMAMGLWLSDLSHGFGISYDYNSEEADRDTYINAMCATTLLAVNQGGICFYGNESMYTGNGVDSLIMCLDSVIGMAGQIGGQELTIRDKTLSYNECNYMIIGAANYPIYTSNRDVDANLPSTTGGVIPLLPANLRYDKRAELASKGINLINKKLLYYEYEELFLTDDTAFVGYNGEQIVFVAPSDGGKATIQPRVNSATSISVTAYTNASLAIQENANEITVSVFNHAPGMPYRQAMRTSMAPIPVQRVEFTVVARLDGTRPTVTYPVSGYYESEEQWNEEKGELTILLDIYAPTTFVIHTDDSGKTLTYPDREAIEIASEKIDADYSALQELITDKVVDKHNYTYYSYLSYNKAFCLAQKFIIEQNIDQKNIDKVVKALRLAKDNLTNISEMSSNINRYFGLNRDEYTSISYANLTLTIDKALREIFSVKQYMVQRSTKLQYSILYKGFGKGDFRVKRDTLVAMQKNLNSAFRSLEKVV